MMKDRYKKCIIHDDVQNIYCEDCEKLVCFMCWKDEHQAHKSNSLNHAYSTKESKFVSKRAKLIMQMEMLDKQLVNIPVQKKQFDDELAERLEELENQKDLLREEFAKKK